MSIIYKTRKRKHWLVVQIKPKDVFLMASRLYESLEKDGTTEYAFYNVTDGQQFRIEVR